MKRKIIRLIKFGPIYRMLWTIREFYFRRFGLAFNQVDNQRGSLSARDCSDTLRRDGCIILPAYFQGEELEALQAEADRLFTQYGERDDLFEHQEFWVYKPFLHSRPLLTTAFDPFLCSIVTNYFSGSVYLRGVDMYRIEPTAEFRGGSFQWHHDAKGKQLKCMLLLTDVSPQDQRMTYSLGSHKPYRFTVNNEETYLESDPELLLEQAPKGTIVDCIGPAGTIIIFDTNGSHSGNRNPSKTRDVLINIYYQRKPSFSLAIGTGYLDTTRPATLRRKVKVVEQ